MFGYPILPMLLKEKRAIFDDKDFLYELKFDGIRAMIHVGKNKFKIFNRHGDDITGKYPELQNIRKDIKENMIFDGEIVSFVEGKPSFSHLQERSHLKSESKIKYMAENNPVCFVVFDCLYKNKSLIKEPLLKRKEVLNQVRDSDYFVKTKYVLQNGKKLFKKVQKFDLEGVVAKRSDSPYSIGIRSNDWIKIKNLKQGVFLIGGFKINQEKISLFLGEYYGKRFCFVGKVSLSKSNKFYKKIIQQPTSRNNPFSELKEKDVSFFKPRLKCEVGYLERTENNFLRQPVFKKEY